MNLRKLKASRTAALTVTGFASVDAGVWTIAANLWGAGIGAGVGLVVAGVLLVVLEWLSGP